MWNVVYSSFVCAVRWNRDVFFVSLCSSIRYSFLFSTRFLEETVISIVCLLIGSDLASLLGSWKYNRLPGTIKNHVTPRFAWERSCMAALVVCIEFIAGILLSYLRWPLWESSTFFSELNIALWSFWICGLILHCLWPKTIVWTKKHVYKLSDRTLLLFRQSMEKNPTLCNMCNILYNILCNVSYVS